MKSEKKTNATPKTPLHIMPVHITPSHRCESLYKLGIQPLDTVLVSSPELPMSPRSNDALIHFQSEIEKLLRCLSCI